MLSLIDVPDVISVGGIYFPVILGFLLITGLVYFVGRWPIRTLHLHRFFWHPALAAAAVFIIVLSCLLLLFGP